MPAPSLRLVILESPYSSPDSLLRSRNLRYSRECLRDSLLRGEAPIASHLLYTLPGVLDDDTPAEREVGIAAGLAWLRAAEASIFYIDYGVTRGMSRGMEAAQRAGVPVEYRALRK